ncbi:transglutaminase-like domain-containing protein [Ideonella paludis]|uniref:transglutaminase-like domain-containing protein n=1 Tax=Ideonella paludis TaxID=1233411 RepID=UPI00362FF50C
MTHPTLTRRHTLQALAAATAVGLQPSWAQAPQRRFEPTPGAWRRFELSTEVQVPEVRGHTRLWLPIPDVESDYQRVEGHRWSGNAQRVQVVADAPRGVRMLMAEFTPEAGLPRLTLTSTLQTRSRAVNWQEKRRVSEDPALLRAALQPTALLPLDGIVRKTAQEATRGARTDLDKVRGIYQWVVTHAHREPKTRGCGTGDIKAMLETGNLGGKCADLNAVFVGLCRAVGVPARDVYGLRLAPSAFGYKELGPARPSCKGRSTAVLKSSWLSTAGWRWTRPMCSR